MEPTRSANDTLSRPSPQSRQWHAEHERGRRPRVPGLHAFLTGAAQLIPQVTTGRNCGIWLAATQCQQPMQASNDRRAAELSVLEGTVNEGPCLDAFATARTQHAPELRTELRWPAFTRAARQRGIGSLLAQPLVGQCGTTLGTLALYSRHPSAFSPTDRQRVADYAVLVADAACSDRLPSRPGSTTGPEPESHLWTHGAIPAELEVTCVDHGGTVVVAVSGDLDLATSPWLRRQLLHVLGDRPSTLVVALDQVSFMDASGLGALAEADRCAHLVGTRFQIAEPRRLIRRMLAITGMDKVMAIYPTLADALADGPHGTPTASPADGVSLPPTSAVA